MVGWLFWGPVDGVAGAGCCSELSLRPASIRLVPPSHLRASQQWSHALSLSRIPCFVRSSGQSGLGKTG